MNHYQNLIPVTSTCICPNCGCNLSQFEDFVYGNIILERVGELQFEGNHLRLPKSQYLIVEALVQAKGRGLTRSLLASILGGDIFDQSISKYIERVRTSFRQVKPDFDQISSMRGFSAYRWEYQPARQPHA